MSRLIIVAQSLYMRRKTRKTVKIISWWMRSEIDWERFDVLGRQKVSLYSPCHSLPVVACALAHRPTHHFPCSRARRQKTPDEPTSGRNLSFYSTVKLFLFPLNTGLRPVIWQVRPCHNATVNSLMHFFFFFFWSCKSRDKVKIKRSSPESAWRRCRSASGVIYNVR